MTIRHQRKSSHVSEEPSFPKWPNDDLSSAGVNEDYQHGRIASRKAGKDIRKIGDTDASL